MDINFKTKNFVFFIIVLLVTILISTIPMKLAPLWNGEIPDHRNQYELLADSFLKGKLYLDYDVDEKLINMDNPYDPEERIKNGVSFHWDHAFYKGKYYVYFGVAPTILTFIPYKVITGNSLTTYKATAFYTSLFIIGLFLLFYNICRYLYPKTKFGIYLLLSSAFSLLSVWICTSRPALYCTAISSGMCMSVWSLYFYFKAVYVKKTLNSAIKYAFFGGLFGALTFACRPPLGLVNLLAIPLVITFFKKYGFNKNVLFKLLIVLIPYLITCILLMIYNYARFESIFEFGQSYQLTVADQHNYLNLFSRFSLYKTIYWILYNFFQISKPSAIFPYINIAGAFINFPILLFPYLLFINKKFRKKLINKNIKWFYISLMILPFIITIFDILGSPYLTERYRLDIYFLLTILTFISIINISELLKNNNKIRYFIWISGLLVIITSVLLFFVPCDYNLTAYYSNINSSIHEAIISLFGLL